MENTKLKNVTFTFINKKGEEKTVNFFMDEKYYNDLQHPSITEEQRIEDILGITLRQTDHIQQDLNLNRHQLMDLQMKVYLLLSMLITL